MKKFLKIILFCVISTAAISNNIVKAKDDRSLDHVAAAVADALATGDAALMEKYACSAEEALSWLDPNKMTKSEYLQRLKEKKKMINDNWREVRDAKMLVEQVNINDVRIKKTDAASSRPVKMIATAIPVFKIKGELTPVPTLRMFFLPIDGNWKYIYQ